ncbi:conserved hypothetical protein [Candidatus Nitrospira nitrosa]|uniref:Fibronectin type-III domain-containing protein n=2 Tax=Candidatus Nitrospira nitrosa TaxID=1742972 RepID=A0A0S4LIT0_9BACT|nr:conserved hypothetical protein [Candidatus Nitrospira nitrosa]
MCITVLRCTTAIKCERTGGVLSMEYSHQAAGSYEKSNYFDIRWFWQALVVAIFMGLGPAAECLAFTVNPTVLTFNAVQSGTNPPTQTLSVYKKRVSQATVTTSDSASWLTISPSTTSMTTQATLMVVVNTSGLAAGTYNATITVKVGKATTTVPVAMTVSSPPSATTAILAWNGVTDPSLSGYNVKVGTASGLYSRTITVGNVTSYTVDSLTTGTTYYFAVTAYNGAGESQPSNEVSKSIY